MESLSDYRKAMKKYRGNVSSIPVRNIMPSGLVGLAFKGEVVSSNIFFKEGQEIQFNYYLASSKLASEFCSASQKKYPVSAGVAYLDGSVSVKRKMP